MCLKVVLTIHAPHLHHLRTYNAINHTRQEVIDQHDQLDHDPPSGYVNGPAWMFQCRDDSFRDRRPGDSSERQYRTESRVRKHYPAVLCRLRIELRVYSPGMNPHDTNAPGTQLPSKPLA